jgi:hypothetical protein
MQLAPLDSLAHLPGPPAKGNRCAAAIHAGQLLAYAASSAVVVVDVSAPSRVACAPKSMGVACPAAALPLHWAAGAPFLPALHSRCRLHHREVAAPRRSSA